MQTAVNVGQDVINGKHLKQPLKSAENKLSANLLLVENLHGFIADSKHRFIVVHRHKHRFIVDSR